MLQEIKYSVSGLPHFYFAHFWLTTRTTLIPTWKAKNSGVALNVRVKQTFPFIMFLLAARLGNKRRVPFWWLLSNLAHWEGLWSHVEKKVWDSTKYFQRKQRQIDNWDGNYIVNYVNNKRMVFIYWNIGESFIMSKRLLKIESLNRCVCVCGRNQISALAWPRFYGRPAVANAACLLSSWHKNI